MRKSLEDRLLGSIERREVEGGGLGDRNCTRVLCVFKRLRHGREHGALAGARIQATKVLTLVMDVN